MCLVVNADDFGKSESVNRAIAECFEKGYIDRTTVMVNMPYAMEAARLSEEKGFKDRVGIHINLTEGKPLTEGISHNPLFCDGNGVFNAAFYQNTLLRLHMDKKSCNDIYLEVKAQLEKYTDLGFTLNHADSHHHVHTNYPVFKALRRLSTEFSFTSIRLSRNLYLGGGFLQRKYKDFYNNCVKKICKDTSDYFGSYEDAFEYAKHLNEQENDGFKKFTEEYSIEIMVHPMYSEKGILVDTKIPFEEENLFYEAIR